MADRIDHFWRAAVDHLRMIGCTAKPVIAPWELQPFLPKCIAYDQASSLADAEAVVVHKGRLEQIAPLAIAQAMERCAASFANEVFIVFTKAGDALAPDHPHLSIWGALEARARDMSSAPTNAPRNVPVRSARMTATYVGHGRVLVETAFGHLMLVDGADTSIAPHLIRDGLFDRDVTLALDALVQPGMVCLDVGANFGTYALIAAANIGPEGRLVAVEPSGQLSELLFENLAMNGFAERCDVLRCAAGPEASTVTLHEFSKRRGGNTLLSHVAEVARTRFGETVHTSQVPCRTIDEIVASLSLGRVDLIKIDVEGYEREVLQGARAAIAAFRPTLFLEWHNAFFDGQPDAPRDLYHLLHEQLGYALHRVGTDGALLETGFDDLLAREHSDIVATPR